MTDRTRNLILTLLGLLAAAVTALVVYFSTPGTPTPIPSPSPSVTASPLPSLTPSPIPTSTTSSLPSLVQASEKFEKPMPPSYALSLTPSLNLTLLKGETTGRTLKISGTSCVSATPSSGITAQLYEMPIVKTTQRSIKTAVLGDHYDPLIPVTQVCGPGFAWIDVSATSSGSFKVGDLQVTVTVLAQSLPAKPSMPFYMGMGSFAVIKGHGIPNAGVQEQAALTKQYAKLLRDHRIEPFYHYIAALGPNTNPSRFSEFGGSFNDIVKPGMLAPPMLGNWDGLAAATLSAVESYVKADPELAGGWQYIIDESSDVATIQSRAALVHQNAPSLKVMTTTEPQTALLGVVDVFVPVLEYFKKAGRWQDYSSVTYWLYGSCMSHGCTTSTATGTPDLMIDEPLSWARAYPLVISTLGAKAALYYNAVESYGSGRDPWTQLFAFGGNGDGQLVYPGISGQRGFTAHTALGSLRLKAIREGMNDVEKVKLGLMTNPVKDQFTWPK